MRKSIVAMLVAIAGLLAWNSANAGEVLWSYTDNTDYYLAPLGAAGAGTTTGWFPLINSVYSDERGSTGQDYVFDSLYVTFELDLSVEATTQDSLQFQAYLYTSNDKSTTSFDSMLVLRVENSAHTYATGAKIYGACIPRSNFSYTSYSPAGIPLARYGRFGMSHFNAVKGGDDSVTVKSYTIRAVGTSR